MIPRHVPALALGTLALGVAEFSMMSILLPVADDLGVTVPEAGHFISAYAAGVCAGVLIRAAAARKMPLKTLLLIIVGIITLGNTLTVFVGSYHLMLFSRFIAGLPHGAYFGAAGVLCTQLAEPGKASRDMCLMVAGMTIANLAGVPCSTLLTQLVSWRLAYGGVPLASFLAWAVSWRAAFAIAAAAALITFAAIRITVPKVPALPDSGFAAQFRFLRSLEPWLVLGAIGLGNGGFFAYYSYVNPVMEHVAAVPASMMSVVITLAGAGMVLGNLFCAKISSSFSDESLAAAAGQGVLLLSLASVFFLAHWSPAAIALTTLAAGCVFFISGPEQVLMIRNAKEGQLLAASLAQVSFNAGNAVGAWLGGLPIDAGKAANWAAMPGFFLALAGFGLLFVNWLIHRVREEERTAGRIAALKDQIQSKAP